MSDPIQAYCVKCKTRRDMLNPEATFTATGTPGTRGTCAVCGTTLFRMGKTSAHEGLEKPAVVAKPTTRKTQKTTKTATKRSTTKSSTKTTSTSKAKKSAGKGRKTTRGKSGEFDESKLPKRVGKLVIVESPAKARSVGQYLGSGYTVKASRGHVRDLLVSQLSVDVENNFEPKYRVTNDKRDVVKELSALAKRANEIYLATDPDREGEAIAWHLISATEIEDKPVKRVVFHEITKPAVAEAFNQPRDIDMNLVNAQQARRIMDRLVGFPVSELLWNKVRNGLSAGRVQSVAVRLIVDREREIEAFVPREYWTLDAELAKQVKNGVKEARSFMARLVKYEDDDVDFGHESAVEPHLAVLKRSEYIVQEVKRGERQRKPSPPFTTSTLQQEASRRLGFSASRTMSVAQMLYQGVDVGTAGSAGLITYMRTDSLNISEQAQKEARDFIHNRFGKPFMPAKAPVYKTKSKGAQEAHEAIRPTDVMRTPDAIRKFVTTDQYKLYNLIWQRFVASQMSNAVYNTLRVDINAGEPNKKKPYLFRVSGSTIKFAGFLALYEDSRDEDMAQDEDEGRILPDMEVGEVLDLRKLLPEQHFTQPPPRFTEATLVRALEEYGIGRPSTYASTVSVIQDRDYVTTKDKRMIPTDIGRLVNDLLVEYFPDIMDFQFTAKMEDELDQIAEGKLEWRPALSEFYEPFERQLNNARQEMPRVEQVEEVGRDCPVCGNPLIIKYGRFGKFIGCSDYPNCTHTEPLLEKLDVPCPQCGKEHGGEIIVRRSKRGKVFYGCSRYPECDFTSWKKPLKTPCLNCGGLLVELNKYTAQCQQCSNKYKISELPIPDKEMA